MPAFEGLAASACTPGRAQVLLRGSKQALHGLGTEDQLLALVRRRMGALWLFSLGVGTAVNRYLLEEMAAMGRGAVQVMRPDQPAASVVGRFFLRISSPVLTDLSVELSEGLKMETATPIHL